MKNTTHQGVKQEKLLHTDAISSPLEQTYPSTTTLITEPLYIENFELGSKSLVATQKSVSINSFSSHR